MSLDISQEIARFEAVERRPTIVRRSGTLRVERLCEHGFVLRGATDPHASLPAGKDIGLALMGITHGNEYAGAAILNEILAHISAGSIELEIPVAFVLGNPWAARENKRFLERDLNRSFARQAPTAKEELRARDLTPVLQRSAFLVDYHQTSRESDRAFFIFPYAPRSFAFAQAMAPRLTVVTHWGKPFSSEGMCTDEYVNSQGGTGVSLEVGQNGLDAYQIAVGVDAGLWAIRAAADVLNGRATLTSPTAKARTGVRTPEMPSEIYTWAEIMPWPEQGYVDLVPNLRNFKDVELGEVIGTVNGKSIVTGHAGKILFPKYLTREQQAALVSRPTELCRIMRRISPSELPTI